jgi:excisionase family DNA binding protein
MSSAQVPSDSSDPYLTPSQAARELGVSIRSVQNWCEQGLIPYVKTMGGHRRIKRSALADCVRVRAKTLEEPCACWPGLMCRRSGECAKAAREAPAARWPIGLTPLSDFEQGQWWLNELDRMANMPRSALTDDLRRAVAVVHNLMRTVQYLNATPAAPAAQEYDRLTPGCTLISLCQGNNSPSTTPKGEPID